MSVAVLTFRRPRWLAVATALVLGAIIHIAVTLSVPVVSKTTAYHRIAATMPVNEMRVLPKAGPGEQILPFMAPDVRVAVCRFDIGNGPVVVSAVLPERGWTMTIYSRHGDMIHAVAAQEDRSTDLGFRLVAAPEPSLLAMLFGGRPTATDTSQVNSTHKEGLVVLRAPVRSASFSASVEAVLGAARCEPEAP
jgi:uncharacterized membrane protein